MFAHRLRSPDAAMRGVTAGEVLRTVVEAVAAPSPAAARV
jgi:hypothetical protein